MEIKERVRAMKDELVELRRYFHAHPEPSWKEFNTQKKIMAYLDELGIPYVPSTTSGLVATLKGPHSSDHIIGIRADIDALPIKEETGAPYASEKEGTMHACGHDTHITILLGTAKVLAAMKDELTVTVRFLFQPAEEEIANSGATSHNGIYGLMRQGAVTTLSFDINIKRIRRAHDRSIAQGRCTNRDLAPNAFQAGTTSNVIPASAHLSGTARTFSPTLREAYPGILRRVARGVGETSRAKIRT